MEKTTHFSKMVRKRNAMRFEIDFAQGARKLHILNGKLQTQCDLFGMNLPYCTDLTQIFGLKKFCKRQTNHSDEKNEIELF